MKRLLKKRVPKGVKLSLEIIQKEMDITMAFGGEQKITNMNRSHLYIEEC